MEVLVPYPYADHSGLSGGWDIFGKVAKEKRKERVSLSAASFQENLSMQKYEQERAAIETFRSKISGKLEEVEQAAMEGTSAMEKARKLSHDPSIAGDPVLAEFSESVEELEVAIVQVQTGTVIDTATFDTHRLAVSYSDAQAALIAMRAITNRAIDLQVMLSERIAGNKRAQAEANEAARQAAVLRQQASREREQRMARAAEEAESRAAADRRRDQAAVSRAIKSVSDEIRKERAALSLAKRSLSEFVGRKKNAAARTAARASRLASLRR